MTSFDERARDWDTEEHVARALAVAEVIRSTLTLGPDMSALEIGAGTGLLGIALAGEIGELVLTDPSAGMREVAAEKVRRQGLRNVRVATFDLTADTAPPGTFDLVLALLMLHHVDDTTAVLRGARDVLAPGGHIAFADLDEEDGTFHDADAEGIHHKGFSRAALGALVASAGFEEITFRDATEIERDGRWYPLFLLTARRPIEGAQSVG
jgi:2-polyprenyl-3-methyl-5-hydroxy-6-metoxy-1,4-benzoquinol methylase